MDPNETLRLMREALNRRNGAWATEDQKNEAAHEAADLADTLDEWLSGGGFLPTEWRK